MRLRSVLFSLLFGVACALSAWNGEQEERAVPGIFLGEEKDSAAASLYERHMDRRMRRWQRLIPNHYKMQYAGSIGVVSAGPGWTYGRSRQWETDLMFGLLPRFESEEVKLVFALRQSYVPWDIRLVDYDFSWKPFSCGLFFSSVLNHNFWVSEPERYPGGYYGFSTRLRANFFMGQRITYCRPNEKRTFAQGISLYYEFSACDTDLITCFGDRCIKFKDIISLAIGLKVHL